MTKSRNPMLGGLLVAISLIGFAAAAVAQPVVDPAAYLAATPTTDASIKSLKYLLGDFVVNPFTTLGGPTTMLGSLFLILNTFIFAVGLLWATYGIGSGIVESANTGEVLGKRLSAVWMPIRMVTGIAGITPIFAGFSLSQAIMMFCCTMGIGAANMAMVTIVDGAAAGTGLLTPAMSATSGSTNVRAAAHALFAAGVCYEASRYEQARMETAPKSIVNPMPPAAGAIGIRFGSIERPGLCGGAQMVISGDGTRDDSFSVNSVNYDQIAQKVLAAHQSQFAALQAKMRTISNQWFAGYAAFIANGANPGAVPPAVPVDEIDSAVLSYGEAVGNALSTQSLGGDQEGAITRAALARMKEYGWFGMGAWFSTFGEVNAALHEAANSVAISAEDPASSKEPLAGLAARAMTAVDRGRVDYEHSKSGSGNGSSGDGNVVRALALETGMQPAGFAVNATDNRSLGQYAVGMAIRVAAVGAGGGELINPIVMFKNLGDWVMTLSQVGMAASVALNAAAAVAGAGADAAGGLIGAAPGAAAAGGFGMAGLAIIGAFGKIASELLMPLLGIMFVLGALMSIYVPMIPFVAWMGGVIQYATVVIEGLAAAPIWALVHLEAQGEGMGQRSERGYIFILNMLFRPFLMVLGFVMASALMIVIGTIQAKLFMPAMANAQGNSVTGLASFIGFLAIFFVLNMTLIHGLFNMIFIIPDQVLGWVGSMNNVSLGRDAEERVKGVFMAAGRFGSGAAESAAGKVRGGLMADRARGQMEAARGAGGGAGQQAGGGANRPGV